MPEKDQIKVVFEIFFLFVISGVFVLFCLLFFERFGRGWLIFKKIFHYFFFLPSFVYETDIEN